jgi:hypothetical protein
MPAGRLTFFIWSASHVKSGIRGGQGMRDVVK